MRRLIATLLSLILFAGCVYRTASIGHFPTVTGKDAGDFAGSYADRPDLLTGDLSWYGPRLYQHLANDFSRETVSEIVKLSFVDGNIQLDAFRRGDRVGGCVFLKERDFTVSSQGIRIKPRKESGSDSNHGVPFSYYHSTGFALYLTPSGDLVVREEGRKTQLLCHVVPCFVSEQREVLYKRVVNHGPGETRSSQDGGVWTADAKYNYDNHCAKCHGADGKGRTRMGTKLKVKDYTDPKVQAELKDAAGISAIKNGIKEGGKTLMKPSEGLSDDEMKALLSVMRTFKK